MDWIFAHAEHLAALAGLLGSAWAFLSKMDRAYREHLKTDLANKVEFQELAAKVDRIENKLDVLTDSLTDRKLHGGHNRRQADRGISSL